MAVPGSSLENVLGYSFSRPELLERALTHRSYANENPENADNERLEFLGDAVIGLAVARHLMLNLPSESEGQLSMTRAQVVSESGLSAIARALGLGTWLRLGKGEEQTGGRDKSSLLADALEAVIGAVFLDGGFAPAQELVDRLLGPALAAIEGAGNWDHKTLLQELAQSELRDTPTYEIVSTSGPDHDKRFEVRVVIDGTERARATGRSKKAAEQLAAEEAFATLSAHYRGTSDS